MNKLFLMLILAFSPYLNSAYIYPEPLPGETYAQCKRAAYLPAAVAIGLLVFTGIITIIVHDGKTAHSSH